MTAPTRPVRLVKGTGWLDGAPMDPRAVAAEPLPTIPGFPFLHPGNAAVISGPTGAGRSSLVQACAYDAARHGLRVAYLGSEVTEPEFNARAADLAERRGDVVDDVLRADLANVRYLNLAGTIAQAWRAPEEWQASVQDRFEVVLVDPLSTAASALDLNFYDSNADFVRFYDRLVQPLVDVGVAVVMLDNIGHDPSTHNRAKGASAKGDRADLTFSCRLQPQPLGLVLVAHKVRSVRTAFSSGARWIFDRDTQSVEYLGAEATASITLRPTEVIDRITRVVEEEPGLGVKALRKVLGGNAGEVSRALAIMVDEGLVEVRQVGQRKQHFLTRVRVSEPCLDGVSDTGRDPVSNRVPTYEVGDTVNGHGHENRFDGDRVLLGFHGVIA